MILCKAAVVVVRHPDADNVILTYGMEATVVDIDLGRSFNGKPDDEEQARTWACSVWRSLDGLPENHPARVDVRGIIGSTVDPFFTTDEVDVLLRGEE